MVMWMCAMMMVWMGGVSMTTLVIIAYVPKREFLASLIYFRVFCALVLPPSVEMVPECPILLVVLKME